MLHTRSCSFVKFQALIVTIECHKCDELSRPLCQVQLNFDVFDHFLKVKVNENFWGALPPKLPSITGPGQKKTCASVNNVGPERLGESGPKGLARQIVYSVAFNVVAVIVNNPLKSLLQK